MVTFAELAQLPALITGHLDNAANAHELTGSAVKLPANLSSSLVAADMHVDARRVAAFRRRFEPRDIVANALSQRAW